MSTFYESGGAGAGTGNADEAGDTADGDTDMQTAIAESNNEDVAPVPAQTLGGQTLSGQAAPTTPATSSARPASKAASIRPTSTKSRIGTFATLGRGGDDDPDEEDEKKKPQSYFAGGEKRYE